MTKVLLRVCLWGALAAPLMALAADYPTNFNNLNTVANTRHNMTQSTTGLTVGSNVSAAMITVRNNYGAVCVYCHTPHGANADTAAPLWNRLVGSQGAAYQVYTSSTMNGVANATGAASLPCLSCHDGTQAVDAIINMPGTGGYATTPNPSNFVPLLSAGQTKSLNHYGLASRQVGSAAPAAHVGCMACHTDPNGSEVATDFTAFLIGTDLRNDHPIGVAFPAANGAGTDWKTPGGTKVSGGVTITYFDEPGTGSGRLDKGDIRLFGAGSDAKVECASCHDPHGVPSGAAGTTFLPTFLRKTIDGSGVCLTCHAK